MTFSEKIVARIKRVAKDLSDDEVLSLYKKVKEKLDSQNKDEDQVLDGGEKREEPMRSENNSLVPSLEKPAVPEEAKPQEGVQEEQNSGGEATEEDIDKSIDDLLSSLGLDDGEEKAEEAPAPETEEQTVQQEPKEASSDDFIGGILKSLDLDTEPENDEEIKQEDKIDNEFSPENFKTAGRGFQVNRKDKDLMSDDATGPKYDEPEKNPPRTDCRRPSGIRWNRGEENQDKDVAGDKDLK